MVDSPLGPVPSDWHVSTVGQIFKEFNGQIQTGPFGSQLHASDYVDVGIPVVMPANIGDNRIVERGLSKVRPADADRLKRHKLQAGDIIFSRRGDVERRSLVRNREVGWLCGTGCLLLRTPAEGVDSEFLAQWFGHPFIRAWLTQHAIGATMLNLNTEILSSVPLVLPPLTEQRAIAGVLGALDDKIESNQRIVRATQELARAELRNAIATSSEIVQVSELLDQVQDRVPSPRSELPYVGLEHFTGFDLALWNFGKSSDSKTATKLASCGDLLFGRIRPYFGNVAITGKSAVVAQSIEVLRPKQVEFSEIAYLSVSSSDFINTAVLYSSGTTMPQVKWTDLKSERVEVPTRQVAQKFHLAAAPLLGVIRQLPLESANLRLLRDTLLPELLSGRLRVRDAEKVVEEVV